VPASGLATINPSTVAARRNVNDAIAKSPIVEDLVESRASDNGNDMALVFRNLSACLFTSSPPRYRLQAAVEVLRERWQHTIVPRNVARSVICNLCNWELVTVNSQYNSQ